jgi:UDP-2,4-diacetamido-2,4,6-trideoxy-beta-L-altropyranose hydrolase
MIRSLLQGRSIVLRTDAGPRIGIGHVRRCLVLAEAAARQGARPFFVLGQCDEGSRTRIESAGCPLVVLDHRSRFDSSAHLAAVSAPSIVIFDLSHSDAINDATSLVDLVAALRAVGSQTVLIDQPGELCLSAAAGIGVDLLVFPYLGAETQAVQPGPRRIVKGPSFAVMDSAYFAAGAAVRVIAPKAHRILVTAGGGDPAGITVNFLEALADSTLPHMDVHVVIGPAFPASTVAAIRDMAASSRHDVVLLDAPDSLADEMAWCDIALSASGVTKYELACTGTPALLVSTDSDHATMNGPFRELGTALDLGVVGTASPHDIAAALKELIADAELRRAMSSAGRAAIDGRGGTRLFAMLAEAAVA